MCLTGADWMMQMHCGTILEMSKDSTHWVPPDELHEKLNGFRTKMMTLLTKTLVEAN
jgi:hypothetical protein